MPRIRPVFLFIFPLKFGPTLLFAGFLWFNNTIIPRHERSLL